MTKTTTTILSTSAVLLAAAIVAAGCSGDSETTATSGGSTVTTGAGGQAGSGGEGGKGASNSSSSNSSSSSTSGMGGAGGTSGAGGTGAGGGGGAAGTGGGGGVGGGGGAGGGGGGSGGGGTTGPAAKCFDGVFVNGDSIVPNYDQFNPIIGSHCYGTNHQDIQGIERVVFLGDSVTVGTPPTLTGRIYRSQLADKLAQKFNIAAPNLLWKTVDVINGRATVQENGAFASCAEWGAQTEDLQTVGSPPQIPDCFTADKLDKKTLLIMTVGGNDIAALAKNASSGATQMDLATQAQAFVQKLREGMAWLYTPGRFPKGINVVFANVYEFTDGTANVQACDVSALAGFDQPIPIPDQIRDLITWINEQYMLIAKDYNADMIFLMEEFCGHGYENNNPQAPCYRGPGTPRWFDITCIHPTPAGHDHVTDMFMAVVNE